MSVRQRGNNHHITLELAKDYYYDERDTAIIGEYHSSYSFFISKLADIAVFRVRSAGGGSFPYFCVDSTDLPKGGVGTATIAALQYYDKPYEEWNLVFAKNTEMLGSGPGDLFQAVRLNYPFKSSMSGGAILVEDKVRAVIAMTLDENGKSIAGENYAHRLRFATDLGLEARAQKCEPPSNSEEPGIILKKIISDQLRSINPNPPTHVWIDITGSKTFIVDSLRVNR